MIICGNDAYLVRRRIRSAIGENTAVFYSDLSDPEAVKESLQLPSVFGKEVIVCKCSPSELSKLKGEYVNDLIVDISGCDRRTKAFKSLKDITICDKSQAQAVSLIKKWGEGRISDEIAHKIVTMSDYLKEESVSLYTLSIYVKELLLLNEGEIKEEALKDVIPAHEADCFAMADKLLQKDCEGLFATVEELLGKGESEIKLLSLVSRPFRLAYLSIVADADPGRYVFLTKLSVGVLSLILDLLQGATESIKSGAPKEIFKITLLQIMQEL